MSAACAAPQPHTPSVTVFGIEFCCMRRQPVAMRVMWHFQYTWDHTLTLLHAQATNPGVYT